MAGICSPNVDPDQTTDADPSPASASRKSIFLLSGQSNMSGRGGVKNHQWDGIIPPECLPNPSILRFTAHYRWVVAREPLHSDIDTTKTCGIGPGMPFANAIRSRLIDPEAVIGLVPCAVGGTAIREWERGSHLYEQMVRRGAAAVAGGDGGGGEIKGVLWYQGESDTHSDHAADTYRANMERLIGHVREDLHSPSLPFIQVAITSGEESRIEKVREAQLAINLPNVVCVDAKGLSLNEDHMHLSTEAQVLLGGMLAEAYINNFLTPAGL